MSNPWLKKNPSVDVWPNDGAGVAPAARAGVSAAEGRQSDAAVTLLMNDLVDLWLQALARPGPQRRGRRFTRH